MRAIWLQIMGVVGGMAYRRTHGGIHLITFQPHPQPIPSPSPGHIKGYALDKCMDK